MDNGNLSDSGARFLTVDAILVEHERLLSAAPERADVMEIRAFIDRLAHSGAYFDEAFERKAAQGILDYWTSELAKHAAAHAAGAEPAGSSRRVLDDFDAQALAALQLDFGNPFGNIAEQVEALSEADRRSAPALLKLISDTAGAASLRFQDGLLKEMASQVTGGREDATLLEFCLWHLFEDPQTRCGNKIYRPRKSRDQQERVDFFSCKVFLVVKADELLEAQAEPERDVLIDALMKMGGGTTGTGRPRPAQRGSFARLADLGAAVLTRVRPAALPADQFSLYHAAPLTLSAFLERSRLAFQSQGRWWIVHPALADRWDPLKKRRWEVEERDKRRQARFAIVSTVVLVALATSLGWYAWYVAWTRLATQHLARAQTSEDSRERLTQAVAGLRAAGRSMAIDSAYAGQIANDAIGAVIGDRARQGTLGELRAYPGVPGIECERMQVLHAPDKYALAIRSDFGPPTKLGGLFDACPLFATNLRGNLLATAWERGGKVDLKVFELASPNLQLVVAKDGRVVQSDLKAEDAAWGNAQTFKPVKLARLLREEPAKRVQPCLDRSLRFSADDKTVSFECLYPAESGPARELEWLPRAVQGAAASSADSAAAALFDAVQKQLVHADSSGAAPADRKGVASVFLGPREGAKPSLVTVRRDGYVQIWRMDKDQPRMHAEFRSDFVRVATGGRPTALAVHDADGDPVYAIYALSPAPVIRVYQQRYDKHAALLMEHYPPNGVGTPVGIRFTSQAQCLQIRTKKKTDDGLVLVDYYLVLDSDRLLAVGEALAEDLELPSPSAGLPAYREAIKKHCFGS